MSFETKARIELISIIIGALFLFCLPVIIMGVGI
jgi:hypothetical protein